MLKWYCDFCKQEIKESKERHVFNNPIQVAAYTEGMNRDLDGYGVADYIIEKEVCCKDCLPKIREAIKKAVDSQKHV